MEAENDGGMGEKMTDEERRKKLVIDLRGYEGYDRRLNTMVHQAANEIERLQGESYWLRTALRAAQAGQAKSNAESPKDLYSGVFRGPDWPNGVFDPPPHPNAEKESGNDIDVSSDT
jgi:hypothetical protein